MRIDGDLSIKLLSIMIKNLVSIFFVFNLYSASGQDVSIDSLFKAYDIGTQYLSYKMKYSIGSIPDSIIKNRISGEMSVLIGNNKYRCKENGIEYVLADGYPLKVNHKKKYLEVLNNKPQNLQFDFQDLKTYFNKLGIKVGLLSKNNKQNKYFLKFPNADSTACTMIQDAKTGYILEYNYNVWSETYSGDFYLKSYKVQYRDFKIENEDALNPKDYILISNGNDLTATGMCAGYRVITRNKSTKVN